MDLLKIKVCVFDVNGVLIDSNSANAQAMAQADGALKGIMKRVIDRILGQPETHEVR